MLLGWKLLCSCLTLDFSYIDRKNWIGSRCIIKAVPLVRLGFGSTMINIKSHNTIAPDSALPKIAFGEPVRVR